MVPILKLFVTDEEKMLSHTSNATFDKNAVHSSLKITGLLGSFGWFESASLDAVSKV